MTNAWVPLPFFSNNFCIFFAFKHFSKVIYWPITNFSSFLSLVLCCVAQILFLFCRVWTNNCHEIIFKMWFLFSVWRKSFSTSWRSKRDTMDITWFLPWLQRETELPAGKSEEIFVLSQIFLRSIISGMRATTDPSHATDQIQLSVDHLLLTGDPWVNPSTGSPQTATTQGQDQESHPVIGDCQLQDTVCCLADQIYNYLNSNSLLWSTRSD